ncbi:MAG: DUF547 domain-containing protein [Phycisphaerae bacterium]|nr:DUF547 domain-containing protein [Phycisphaerae bacterium]
MAFTKRTAGYEKPKTAGFKALNLSAFITLPVVLILITGCSNPSSLPLEQSTVSCDGRYTDVLKSCVDGRGMVDYRKLKSEKPEINRILDVFSSLDPNLYNSWSKEDKIAFWLNAYNVKMLKIICDNYPIESQRILRVFWGPESIRHIRGIWDEYKFIVMNEEFTLKEIEQRLFSKEFDEPRIFLAIAYASISGPPLRNEPYYGRRLYQQLDNQARKFLSSPLAFRIDRENSVVYLSAIFHPSWFGNAFLSKYGTDKKFKDQQPSVRAVLNFAANYISAQDKSFLEIENYSVKYMTYNWNINDSSSLGNNQF